MFLFRPAQRLFADLCFKPLCFVYIFLLLWYQTTFFQKFATLEYISILFCHYLFFATYIYLVFWILLIFWAKYSLPDVLLKDRIANEKLPAMTYYYDALFRDIIMKVWIFAKPRTDQPSYDITFSSIIQNDYENINVFLSDR